MNPLDEYPQARKYLYMFQWLVNGVLTIAGAYFLIEGTPVEDLPKWYYLTLGIAPVLWTVLGITAQTNVAPKEPEPVEPPANPPANPQGMLP
jgi:hypothetical protein